MLPLVIEPKELQQHLTDENLLLVDLSNPQNYAAGHIPGAVQVLPQELVAGTPPAPGQLPSVERLSQLFSRIGLTPDTHVVVYDDEGGGWAGRFIWTLDVVGHKSYSYLNGGLWAWHGDKLPLSQDIAQPSPSKVSVTIDASIVPEKQTILDQLDDEHFVVWDARTVEEYLGQKQTAQKNGHIPGAIHCEWTELMDRNENLRIRADADDYLQHKGFSKNQHIVTHCHSHHRSGFTYLVGKVLGYNVKAYSGSWSEWGNAPDTPVET
jgi:thiosulfate/3-mercaptopyruvate sulfurtransferase